MNYGGGKYRYQKHHTDPDRRFLSFPDITVTRCSGNTECYQRDDSNNENN